MAADNVFICEGRLCIYIMKVSVLEITTGNSIFYFFLSVRTNAECYWMILFSLFAFSLLDRICTSYTHSLNAINM